jgi:hypothetical protein
LKTIKKHGLISVFNLITILCHFYCQSREFFTTSSLNYFFELLLLCVHAVALAASVLWTCLWSLRSTSLLFTLSTWTTSFWELLSLRMHVRSMLCVLFLSMSFLFLSIVSLLVAATFCSLRGFLCYSSVFANSLFVLIFSELLFSLLKFPLLENNLFVVSWGHLLFSSSRTNVSLI